MKRLIKEARIRKGFSQEYLARQLNISVRTYQKIESTQGYLPNVKTGLKLATLLDTSPYDLWSIE
ncbi:MAG: helix-turn-helix transcriptional regulator [Peptococcaceae bacterium]|nr:helix-turn-helix transcriptional regulator [Peptococcaceae bacterium]